MNFEIKKTLIKVALTVIVIVTISYANYFFSKSAKTNQPTATIQPEQNGFKLQPLSQGFSLTDKKENNQSTVSLNKTLPPPDKFKIVIYAADKKSFIISGQCSDVYYTVLLYKKSVDYRKYQAPPVFNKAYECPTDKKFKIDVSQEKTNLSTGEYYVIIADQGAAGSWYNPR